jgi:CO/xanthine dehydrogenase Mo-binding subunit
MTMAEYRAVGRPTARVEGVGKVTGRTVYTADVRLPGMLHAKLLRSPHAHARIRRIDTARAAALEGVVAVVTAADLPPLDAKRVASNRAYGLLAAQEVVFAGQPVVAVVARDPATAEEALDLIEAEYEELPAVLDPLEALKEDSPLARSSLGDADRSESWAHAAVGVEEKEPRGRPTNVASRLRFTRGDVEQGLAEADLVVERTYRTPVVHQGYIEPHATVADYDAASGDMTIYTATQGQFFVRDEIARMFQLPETKVRVVGLELGGGFGGKMFLFQGLCAALALVVKKPVKLVLTRTEDLTGATPAPQAVFDLKTGTKRDGMLTALQARAVYDSGAFSGAAMAIGCVLLGGYYRCPNLEIEGFEVLTNKVSVGAYRAPAVPSATFAIDSQMDIMARELGLDPLEVRLKNAVQEGDPLPTETPYPRIGLRECLERVRDSDLWRQRPRGRPRTEGRLGPPGRDQQEPEAGPRRRGVGLAAGGWLGGLQPAAATVMLNGDGTIGVLVGSNDITGTNTSFVQIAAEELCLPVSQVRVSTGDTRMAPFAGMTAGSKTLFTVGRAVKAAAEDARRQILGTAAQRLEVPVEDLECADGVVRARSDPEKSITFGRLARITTDFGAAYPPVVGRGAIAARKQAPGFSVQAAEVEVDTETGRVRVLRYVTAQDVGFAINPLSVEGQMEGGTTQGIGMGLYEEMVYGDRGQLLNPSLLDYRLPTAADVPNIESLIVEVPSEDGPYGARGVGEPPVVPTSAAIANAVHDAIGVRITEIPITPERILRALGRVKD